MVTVTVDRHLDVTLFCELVEDGSKAGEEALYKSIAAATPDELAPFLQERNETGQTALLYAAALGSVRLVRLLVQKGADHTVLDEDDGCTILMKGNGALHFFLQQLDCSSIINLQDKKGQTALHWALEYQDPEDVELFLKHGANPNIQDNQGATPLYWAASDGEAELAAVLWKGGASVTNVSDGGCTILMVAAKYSIEVLRQFLQELDCVDILINSQDHNGWTALHWANENPLAVELLFQYGANPNIQNNQGATPLHLCACNGNAQSGSLLLQYGANLRLTDHMQRNIMHNAFANGIVHRRTQFVQWLLFIRAEDLMLNKDQFGRTPLDEAFRQEDNSERQHITSLLLHQYTTKIVAQEGGLCLHWVLRAARYKKGKVLLPAGTLTIERILAFLTALLTLMESVGLNLISGGDDTGALPLHVACQCPKTPIQLIAFLVERDPSTARRMDHAGNFPIHGLCASRPSLHIVKHLLGCDAASISACNNQGRSPFEVAALASASVEVVWYLMKIDPFVALASLCRPSKKRKVL